MDRTSTTASRVDRTKTVVGAALAAGLILHGIALFAPAREAGPGGWPPAARADGVAAVGQPAVLATTVKDGAGLIVWNLAAGQVDYYEADLRMAPQSGTIGGVFHGTAPIKK